MYTRNKLIVLSDNINKGANVRVRRIVCFNDNITTGVRVHIKQRDCFK